MTRILVTGATGTVGTLLLPLVARSGRPVRALSRSPETQYPAGVEPCRGDLTDPVDRARAMEGVTTLFLLNSGADLGEKDAACVASARAAGIRRIVKLSVLSAGWEADDPITRWHRAGEAAVRDSGIAWTFLRPNAFMSNALSWGPAVRAGGPIEAPFAAATCSAVDPLDIAELAARSLLEDHHAGRAYDLTGPAGISVHDQARLIGRSAGRRIPVFDLTPEAATARLIGYGMSRVLAEAVVALQAGALDPRSARAAPDIEEATAHPPHGFADWLARNAAAFSGAPGGPS